MTRNRIETKRLAKKHFAEFVEDDYTELWILSEYLFDHLSTPSRELVLELVKEVVSELTEENGIYVLNVETELRSEMTQEQVFSEIDLIFEKTDCRPTSGDLLGCCVDTSIS